jgi:hypothetical protein
MSGNADAQRVSGQNDCRTGPPSGSPTLRIASFNPNAQVEMYALMSETPSSVALVRFNTGGRRMLEIFDLRHRGPWEIPSDLVPELNRHLPGICDHCIAPWPRALWILLRWTTLPSSVSGANDALVGTKDGQGVEDVAAHKPGHQGQHGERRCGAADADIAQCSENVI